MFEQSLVKMSNKIHKIQQVVLQLVPIRETDAYELGVALIECSLNKYVGIQDRLAEPD